MAIKELRDEESLKRYNSTYDKLWGEHQQQREIRKLYPLRIYEPETF